MSRRIKLAIPLLLWGIWKQRNDFVFEKKQSDVKFLVDQAFEDALLWFKVKEKEKLDVRLHVSPFSRLDTRWRKPCLGRLKCNLHVSWVNASSLSGGAWLLRDSSGEAIFHARDAFLASSCSLVANFQVLKWTLQSLRDLHIQDVEVWCDCSSLVSAVLEGNKLPRFRTRLDRISSLVEQFQFIQFHVSHFKANSLAREIACSVTRDGRFRSYLSIGGPSWLQSRILEESRY